jgi:aryl-alcohol dehydrogenase-like predicted oxidoreductase
MITTTLGDTGLRVSRLGLGLAALGRPGYINLGHRDDLHSNYDAETMKQQTFRVLDEAYHLGIRYFDAARSYGRGEEFLGAWLESASLSQIPFIASKWGYTYTADWQVTAEKHEIKDHNVDTLRRQIGESRNLLASHLALYQIHSATRESGVLKNAEVLRELARLRESGLLLGLSVTGATQSDTIRDAISLKMDGVRLFSTIQATWNLLERSSGPALAEAHAAGMGVIIKEGLANGRLTGRNQSATFAQQRQLLETTAHRLGATLDALALAAILARPWVHVVLSGAATVEQLQSNVAALKVSWDDQAESQLATLTESAQSYWQTRSELTWN